MKSEPPGSGRQPSGPVPGACDTSKALRNGDRSEAVLRQVSLVAAFHDHISCAKSAELLEPMPCESDHLYAHCGDDAPDDTEQDRLRAIVVLHTDLIQHQQELIAERDRQIDELRVQRDEVRAFSRRSRPPLPRKRSSARAFCARTRCTTRLAPTAVVRRGLRLFSPIPVYVSQGAFFGSPPLMFATGVTSFRVWFGPRKRRLCFCVDASATFRGRPQAGVTPRNRMLLTCLPPVTARIWTSGWAFSWPVCYVLPSSASAFVVRPRRVRVQRETVINPLPY